MRMSMLSLLKKTYYSLVFPPSGVHIGRSECDASHRSAPSDVIISTEGRMLLSRPWCLSMMGGAREGGVKGLQTDVLAAPRALSDPAKWAAG